MGIVASSHNVYAKTIQPVVSRLPATPAVVKKTIRAIQFSAWAIVITLDFFLGSAEHRQWSIAKINLLLDVLIGFKEALEKESRLIEKHSAKKKD